MGKKIDAGEVQIFIKEGKTREELFYEYIWANRFYVWKVAQDQIKSEEFSEVESAYLECLVVLFRGIHTYKPEIIDLDKWMGVCSRRHCNKISARKNKEFGRIEFNANDLTTHHITDTENQYLFLETETEVNRENLLSCVSDELLAAISDLEEDQQEVFKLIYLDGYRYKDIKRYFDERGDPVSMSGVKRRIAFIRKSIMGKLKDYYESKDY